MKSWMDSNVSVILISIHRCKGYFSKQWLQDKEKLLSAMSVLKLELYVELKNSETWITTSVSISFIFKMVLGSILWSILISEVYQW